MSWDFALILFVLLILTGAIWFLDRFSLRSRRLARAQAAMQAMLDRMFDNGLTCAAKLARAVEGFDGGGVVTGVKYAANYVTGDPGWGPPPVAPELAVPPLVPLSRPCSTN